MGETSVVTSAYGAGQEALGAMGVLGPTRMDYPGTMASVRAVAMYLSKILDQG
jgi:heat-inducible transcriptional repressor